MEDQPTSNQVQQAPVNPVAPKPGAGLYLAKSNYCIIGGIILILFLIFSTIYVRSLPSRKPISPPPKPLASPPPTSPTPTPIVIPTIDPSITANWKTYTDQELGISFRYPPEWGDIKKDRSADCWQGAPQPCAHIFLTLPKVNDYNILLGSGNVSYINNVVGKGAYFGERIGKASRYGTPIEKFVRDYCTANESEGCETKTNQYGVFYTKSLETNYETLEGLALYYFVYHPNHQFEGITLSNERFLNTAFSESSEINLDQILSTFQFLN